VKRLLALIVLLAIPQLAHAQAGGFLRNDGAFTPTPAAAAKIGNQDQQPSSAAVDVYGRIPALIIPSAPSSSSYSEAVPNPMVVFQATAVPTTVPTPQFVNTTAMRHSFVDNSTNQEVYVHLNGSITPIARVPAGSVWFRNWGATGSKMSGSIAVTRPGTLPTSGSIAIGGDS
jgi:hypothetical protein